MIENNINFQVINQAYPHIGKKLDLFWGCPEFNATMEHLQTDTRGGTRAGFPGPVLNALFMLAMEHEEAFPKLLGKQDGQRIATGRK